ncbi:hypothetical protein EWM64_g9532 [Hericium alpestre]|uniref:Microbial-type PARG catalytic domain-containing protein n=1 Tax=Hericium alpestre TaxID=135208 RepID=A0A4Y9ZM20_9AGAM|nr:hypothetical protein EWM64_g9532 [Hericium alpestre]
MSRTATLRTASRSQTRSRRSKAPSKRQSSHEQTIKAEHRTRSKRLSAEERKRRFQHSAVRAKRSQWALIAQQTRGIVMGDGKYVETRRCRVPSLADILDNSQRTPALSTWHIVHDISSQGDNGHALNPDASHVNDDYTTPFTSIGVLSSASPRCPGGAYLSGSSEPEAVLARSTSLVASLHTPQAQQFYRDAKLYAKEHGATFFPHSLVYSPAVVGLRRDDEDRFNKVDDDFDPEMDAIPADPTTKELELPPAVNGQNQKAMGEYVAPYVMNVVSAVPVLASSIRSARHLQSLPAHSSTTPSSTTCAPPSPIAIEDTIRRTMKERMARVLRLFELRGDRVLVLGAFGCNEGNSVDTVARIWAELIACNPGEDGTGAFRNVFEKVVFAVPGKLYVPFRESFDMRVYEDRLEAELSIDV